MSRYLLIESRDTFNSAAVRSHLELAIALRRAGAEVQLFLVQNGVLPCRSGADDEALHEAITAGVEVVADDFSLLERGIAPADVARGVRRSPIAYAVDRLADSWKVVFL